MFDLFAPLDHGREASSSSNVLWEPAAAKATHSQKRTNMKSYTYILLGFVLLAVCSNDH